MRRGMRYGAVALLLAAAQVLAPAAIALRGEWVATARAQGQGQVFMPLLVQQVGPPVFAIIAPANGWMVGGMTFFAVQPADPATVTSVTFRAGATTLGTDSQGADGFKVFFDAGALPAGAVQLTAVASGPGGAATRTITVQVTPDPPASAAVGAQGGVLATHTGSVITIPPGALPSTTQVTVTERTIQEVTARHGIDWEAMGVVFLGAQEIEANAEFRQPLVEESAGFGNRVQPGQAVVNYRIMPDVDGDGVDELVVVNTASVAPNNAVISDPVPRLQITSIGVLQGGALRVAQTGAISGPPGTIIQARGTGFNPVSIQGNVALFRSAVNGREMELPAVVLPDVAEGSAAQTLRVPIPPLPPGAATVTFRNESSGSALAPIELVVEEAPPLSAPAGEIIDASLRSALASLAELKTLATAEGWTGTLASIDQADAKVRELRVLMQEMADTPDAEEQRILRTFAVMMENSQLTAGLATLAATLPLQCPNPPGKVDFIATALATFGAFLMGVGFATGTLSGGTLVIPAAGLVAIGGGALLIGMAIGMWFGTAANPDCWEPPPPPPSPGNGGNGTMGMGSAPPPGGDGWGNASGPPPLGLSAASSAGLGPDASLQAGGRIMVKVFSQGVPTVFTGMVDAGGYFYIPLIPANQEFVAIATDMQTKETRTVEGVGPQEGDSVGMFFDFLSEETAIETVRWDGGGDGASWHDPFNWNPNTVPGATQHVVIDVPGDVTVTHSRETDTIRSLRSAEEVVLSGGTLSLGSASVISDSLTLSGGTLEGAGNLTVNGLLRWTSGIMQGSGTTIANGGMELSVSTKQLIGGRRLEGHGNAIWSGGAIIAGNGAVWHNSSDATLDIQHNGTLSLVSGTSATFENAGTVVKSGGDGVAYFFPMLVNSGSVTVQTGSLSLRGGSQSTGTFAGMGVVEFSTGNHVLAAGSEVNGKVSFAAGTTTIQGDYAALDTSIGSGSAVFEVAASSDTLTLSGGILDGPGNVTVNGLLRWTSGIMQGSGTTIANGGMELSVSTKQLVGGRRLEGHGNAIWSGGAIIAGNGAVWHNSSDATLDIQHNGTLSLVSGTSATFENAGAVVKSGGDGVAYFFPMLVNSGSVTVQTGSLSLRGGSQSTGAFAGMGVVEFSTGNHVLAAGSEVNGKVAFAAGTTTIQGDYAATETTIQSGSAVFEVAASSDTLTLSGGILDGPGNVTVNGLLRWTSGIMQGSGTTIANGGMELSVSTKQLIGGRRLEGHGNAIWSGGAIIAGNGAVWHNSSDATLDIQHNGTLSLVSGTSATFENAGAVVKSGGDGVAYFFPMLVNSGSVRVDNGSIEWRGGFSQAASGVLHVQIGGTTPLTEFDQYRVTGQATLGGTLNVTLRDGFMPDVGDLFVVMTFTSRSGTFATVNGNGQGYAVNYGAAEVTLTAE